MVLLQLEWHNPVSWKLKLPPPRGVSGGEMRSHSRKSLCFLLGMEVGSPPTAHDHRFPYRIPTGCLLAVNFDNSYPQQNCRVFKCLMGKDD